MLPVGAFLTSVNGNNPMKGMYFHGKKYLFFNLVFIFLMTTEDHPFNIGTNIYGVGACLVFFQLIFTFEIHHRFGPILFCIKNIFWDIVSGI